MFHLVPRLLVALAALALALPAWAAEAHAATTLDSRLQDLKSAAVRLDAELLALEEELLYPPGTQVALFVSMDVGASFEPESVQLKLDDKLVASHLYTPLEVQALRRGGMQRLYLGNLLAGKHAVAAAFTGRGMQERDAKRDTTLEFNKGAEPRYIELRIKDAAAKPQPELEVKVWQ